MLEELERTPHPLLFEILELRAYAALKRAWDRAKPGDTEAWDRIHDSEMYSYVEGSIRRMRREGKLGPRLV